MSTRTTKPTPGLTAPAEVAGILASVRLPEAVLAPRCPPRSQPRDPDRMP